MNSVAFLLPTFPLRAVAVTTCCKILEIWKSKKIKLSQDQERHQNEFIRLFASNFSFEGYCSDNVLQDSWNLEIKKDKTVSAPRRASKWVYQAFCVQLFLWGPLQWQCVAKITRWQEVDVLFISHQRGAQKYPNYPNRNDCYLEFLTSLLGWLKQVSSSNCYFVQRNLILRT